MATRKKKTATPPAPAAAAPAVGPPATRTRKALLLRTVDEANATIAFTDSKTGESVRVELRNLPVETKVKAALFGINRKVDGTKDSLSAARQIAAGAWPGGIARGGGLRKPPIACEAVARVSKLPLAQVQARWQQLSPEEKKRIQHDYHVQAMVKMIRAERQAGESSVAALFGDGSPTPAMPPAASIPQLATEPFRSPAPPPGTTVSPTLPFAAGALDAAYDPPPFLLDGGMP